MILPSFINDKVELRKLEWKDLAKGPKLRILLPRVKPTFDPEPSQT